MVYSAKEHDFTILAVDDTDIFLDIIEDAVGHMGNFICAKNGEIALLKAREHRPDIILLDIELPDINGLELARLLNADKATSQAPIIFFTSHDEYDYELEAFLRGGVDFISKPIRTELLRARVQTQLRLISRTRQLRKAHDELANYVAKLDIFVSYWSHDFINIYNNDGDGKWFKQGGKCLVGQPLSSLFHANERKQVVSKIRENISSKNFDFEISFSNYSLQRKNVNVTIVDDQVFDITAGFLMFMSEKSQNRDGDYLGAESNKLKTTLTAVDDGIITTDINGKISYVNPAAQRLMGLKAEGIVSLPIEQAMILVDKNTKEAIDNPVKLALSERVKATSNSGSLLVNANKQHIEVEDSASPIFDDQNRLVGAVLVFKDLSRKREDERTIFHLSNHDSLTNLPNRALILGRAEQAAKESNRTQNPMAILMINIDNFQRVNDVQGYSVGDQVLQLVATSITGSLRDCDTVSRQGGDEFVAILPAISKVQNVSDFCKKIKADLAALWKGEAFNFDITLSIGIAIYPDDCTDVHQLYRQAHTAMKAAKRLGHDHIHFFSKQLEAQVRSQQVRIDKLNRAIVDEQIILYYQPKIDSQSACIGGFEALARWPQKDGSVILPAEFIPLAEETKLIIPLGESLLYQACKQTVEWQKTHPNLHISVNISPIQFTCDLIEKVDKALVLTGLNPSCLVLEITESVLLNDQNSKSIVRKLKKLGLKISIDDFGTGYSSLSYIKNYAFDELKIDQRFVRDMLADRIDTNIVKTMIDLAKNLNIQSVAEGVESQEHADLLKGYGCKFLQGYYYGPPIPSQETSDLLTKTKPN